MSESAAKKALLHGPLAKIERAKKHINDLNGAITAYLSSGPFELRICQGNNPPQRLVYTKTNVAIPDDLSLIVGDAAHNLRASLDHICFGMVGSKAPRPDRIGFPFARSEDGLADTIAGRQMHVAPKYVIDEIHALKPYPGGNEFLYAVNRIDNRDKHEFIVTTGLGIEMTAAQLQTWLPPGTVECDYPDDTPIGTVGDFVCTINIDEPVETFDKKADAQPLFTVGFGEGEPLVSFPVIPAMKEMAVQTEAAVRRLAAAYFR